MNRDEFEALVKEAVGSLPKPIADKLSNTLFIIEPGGDGLLGLYQGQPLPDRGEGPPVFPDRITLYQKDIELEGGSRDGVLHEIQKTVLHEVGHFLGLDEDDLHRMGLG